MIPLAQYKEIVSDFLAQQNPSVVLPDDDPIWIVVRIAHGQNRGVIWTAALALSLSRASDDTPTDNELLQVK